MKKSKTVGIVILITVIVSAALGIYLKWMRPDHTFLAFFPLDSVNGIGFLEVDPPQGDEEIFAVRVNIEKGELWKQQLELENPEFSRFFKQKKCFSKLDIGTCAFFSPGEYGESTRTFHIVDDLSGEKKYSLEFPPFLHHAVRPLFFYNEADDETSRSFIQIVPGQDDRYTAVCMDGSSGEARWTKTLGKGELSLPLETPTKVLLHRKKSSSGSIQVFDLIILDRTSGEYTVVQHISPGVLFEDRYIFGRPSSLSAPSIWQIVSYRISSGDEKELFLIDDYFLGNKFSIGSSGSLFALYKNSLLYPATKGSQQGLKAVSLDSGRPLWFCSWPEGYERGISYADFTYQTDPLASTFYKPESTVLPFLLLDRSEDSFLDASDPRRFRFAVVDIDTGSILYITKPVLTVGFDLNGAWIENSFYKDGYYYFQLPNPLQPDSSFPLVAMNGSSGTIENVFLLESINGLDRNRSYQNLDVNVHPVSVEDRHFFFIDEGNPYILDLDKKEIVYGNTLLNSVEYIDFEEEMGALYGF